MRKIKIDRLNIRINNSSAEEAREAASGIGRELIRLFSTRDNGKGLSGNLKIADLDVANVPRPAGGESHELCRNVADATAKAISLKTKEQQRSK